MPAPDPEPGRQVLTQAWWRAVGGAPPVLVPLGGGSESAPWRVTGPAGRFTLRRYGFGPEAMERATAALAAAGAASRQEIPAPRPVPTDDGQAFRADARGEVWTLSRWVPGRPRRNWLQLPVEQAGAFGLVLAGLHAALRTLPPDLARPDADAGLPRTGRPRDQVLHGDPTQGNVLWFGRGPGLRVGFVDFDRVDRGPVERDLARALVGMAPWAGAGSTQTFGAFLGAYAAAGGRPSAHRLREAIAYALAEGEAWLAGAHLSDRARRAGVRWLARARAVEFEPAADALGEMGRVASASALTRRPG